MEFDMKLFLALVRKRLLLLIAVTAGACMLTAYLSTSLLTPKYDATTKLMIGTAAGGERSITDINEVQGNIKLTETYKEILTSPPVLEAVALAHPEFGLDAEKLGKLITVHSVNETPVMIVTARAETYARAADIVNAVAAGFRSHVPLVMGVDNVKVLNEASIIGKPEPASPNVELNVMIAAIVSLMVMLAGVFLMEYFNDSIRSEEDLERFAGIKTLAAIGKIRKKDVAASDSKKTNKKVGDPTNANVSLH
ncbi:YveK family protein [Paenibacillus cymbidii]|uniref:YveK family protein n=1 Tax=Paenibacillus cymbidii TaxID=1639034 RepID=UPI001081AE7E|nr:Wzz/FepE/Etk N-terminal domain-containing protein [Paenibacillus cymbidii]